MMARCIQENRLSLATFAAAQLIRVLPRTRVSRVMGQLADQALSARASRLVVGAYARAYRVNLEEAERPPGGFTSFDSFFTRRLVEGARPLAAAHVISPADGVLASTGRIDASSRLVAKGQPYEVGELTGEPGASEGYAGGSFAVIYLSPRDYHRVHSPVAGQLTSVRGIPGDLYPVNRVGERHVPRLFARNHRVSLVLETPQLGRVTVVMVGAMIVGRISVSAIDAPAVPAGVTSFEPPRAIAQGEELGQFHLGSTAVVLVEAGVALTRPTGPLRLGEALSGEP